MISARYAAILSVWRTGSHHFITINTQKYVNPSEFLDKYHPSAYSAYLRIGNDWNYVENYFFTGDFSGMLVFLSNCAVFIGHCPHIENLNNLVVTGHIIFVYFSFNLVKDN